MSTSWQGNSHGQQYDKDGLPVNNSGAGSNNDYYAAFAQPQQPQQTQYSQPQYGQPQQGQVQPYNQYQQPMATPKNKIVAALLFFFLGELGIGNFYMGQTNLGITKLVLFFIGVFTFIFIIGAVILGALWIWKMVEFVMVLTGGGGYDRDANGVPLR
ncbi:MULTISPECIES: TM2 domain-containing protein [unclassified Corynebacterium]|uniref:TM2 domain-containing protein n=1 Tax=unclassified Corynebacterium TaxID=2624378 RepID=UPI0026561C78|nr:MULTISPECIES: TM2 domain-containing protein [unclassified Corynebacterium]MDN8595028.1 TM2 domain-containing protein [Corynebacterium sp. P4_F2]WKK55419.1 TM2 domain-containing protein [Corynebacterium sp. P4-C1]WKK62828.1 TM2 domain-containing protein [Corynebacterium sp. P8-C1]